MRPIFPPPTNDRAAARGAFTLIEAVVALVATAFVATAAARIAIGALERERKAVDEAAAARAVRALAAGLTAPEPDEAKERSLPDGWRAVRRGDTDESRTWQSWDLFAPGAPRAGHTVHLPAPVPRREPDLRTRRASGDPVRE